MKKNFLFISTKEHYEFFQNWLLLKNKYAKDSDKQAIVYILFEVLLSFETLIN